MGVKIKKPSFRTERLSFSFSGWLLSRWQTCHLIFYGAVLFSWGERSVPKRSIDPPTLVEQLGIMFAVKHVKTFSTNNES